MGASLLSLGLLRADRTRAIIDGSIFCSNILLLDRSPARMLRHVANAAFAMLSAGDVWSSSLMMDLLTQDLNSEIDALVSVSFFILSSVA